jgi:hypothetical protein
MRAQAPPFSPCRQVCPPSLPPSPPHPTHTPWRVCAFRWQMGVRLMGPFGSSLVRRFFRMRYRANGFPEELLDGLAAYTVSGSFELCAPPHPRFCCACCTLLLCCVCVRVLCCVVVPQLGPARLWRVRDEHRAHARGASSHRA